MAVYVFTPSDGDPKSGSARQVAVETGISEAAEIQILADEIVEGMQVITQGAERIRPFQPVQIVEESNPSMTPNHRDESLLLNP